MKRSTKCLLLFLTLFFTFPLVQAAVKPADGVFLVKNRDELSNALNQVKPGGTIKLAKADWKDLTIDLSKNGTAAQPITLTVETPGEVFITGQSEVVLSGNYLILDGFYFKDGYPKTDQGAIKVVGSHNRVTNCSIVGYNFSPYKWVGLWGAYNRVDHCFFQGKNTKGSLLVVWRDDDSPNYHQIDHNIFRDYASGKGENSWETIRVGTSDHSQSASYTTVEYNYFENCNGEVEMISNKSCNNVYRFNTVINSQGQITMRHGNNCRIEGNVIKSEVNNTGGIRIMDKNHVVINNYIQGTRSTSNVYGGIVIMNHNENPPLNDYWAVIDAKIENNTIINCEQSFILGTGRGKIPPVSASFKNNLVVNSLKTDLIFRIGKGISQASYSGNVVFGGVLGLTEVPDGITLGDPQVSTGPDGLYYAADKSIGAHPPVVLNPAEVGPVTYRPN